MLPTPAVAVTAPRCRWRRVAAWAVVLAMLAGVFAAYLRPDLMFTLANQVWACF